MLLALLTRFPRKWRPQEIGTAYPKPLFLEPENVQALQSFCRLPNNQAQLRGPLTFFYYYSNQHTSTLMAEIQLFSAAMPNDTDISRLLCLATRERRPHYLTLLLIELPELLTASRDTLTALLDGHRLSTTISIDIWPIDVSHCRPFSHSTPQGQVLDPTLVRILAQRQLSRHLSNQLQGDYNHIFYSFLDTQTALSRGGCLNWLAGTAFHTACLAPIGLMLSSDRLGTYLDVVRSLLSALQHDADYYDYQVRRRLPPTRTVARHHGSRNGLRFQRAHQDPIASLVDRRVTQASGALQVLAFAAAAAGALGLARLLGF